MLRGQGFRRSIKSVESRGRRARTRKARGERKDQPVKRLVITADRKFVTPVGDCGFHQLYSARATLAMCED
jgi:hypothetical protein